MTKAVIDTVVFVRSLINPFSRWGELLFFQGSLYKTYASEPVIEEYLEVLHRPEIVKKFKVSEKANLKIILNIIESAIVVKIEEIGSVSRDPNDNIFLATAKASKADFLVTEDQDLLVLKEFKGTKIITAIDFLRIIKGVN
ncbi:MAG: putative toxin-antitoxin system toxin component, PIN family [bacterium]|nr:putative toxin-antitoxin system toxin component, PIN family [bacterium]